MRTPFHFRLTPVVVGLMGCTGDEARALVARCGLPPGALAGPCTSTLRRVQDLVDAAQSAVGPTFGLLLAAAVPHGTYGAAEVLVRTAPTLDEGLVGLARFAALINPIGRFEHVEAGDRIELHYSVPGHRACLGEPLNVFTIAYIVRALRSIGLPDDALVATWFAHTGSRARVQLREYFRCPVSLGAPTCGFAFLRKTGESPLRTSDRVTHRFLEHHAAERLAALGDRTVAALVAEEIGKQVSLGGIELSSVAARIGMSERTAQRRLAEEGTSFRRVLDQVRERIAEDLIATGMPLSRIARLLGFADGRGLRRAIARWERADRRA